MKKTKKILIAIIITIAIVGAIGYTTYSFYTATATDSSIEGSSKDLNFDITAKEIYKATGLIPISEETADLAINNIDNQCKDNNNQDLCSLYEVTLTNSGVATSLTGFIRTNSSTYITNNLKYKVYTKNQDTYTAVTDLQSLSNDSGGSTYFKKDNNNYVTTLNKNETVTYYILFWLNEASSEQNDDQEKNYNCKFGFEGVNGSKLSASFSV